MKTTIRRFSARLCRVYFNRDGDAPKVWSVDSGPGTPEVSTANVFIDGASGVTRYQPKNGDGTGAKGEDLRAPRAWLEFQDVTVSVEAGGVLIRERKAR
jgi:hypothetical protein